MKGNNILSLGFLWFLAMGLLSGCEDTPVTSTTTSHEEHWIFGPLQFAGDERLLSGEVTDRYRTDAEKLAVRLINQRDSTRTDIPGNLVSHLYNGLILIATSDHPKVQEIAALSPPIHARNPEDPREILVFVDTTAGWIDAWRTGMVRTGEPAIDQLIDRFNFTLEEYDELAAALPTGRATLRTDRPINGFAVGRLFEQVAAVDKACPNRVTDGSDIRMLLFSDHIRFTFELGFGDCPSGCLNYHRWNFGVSRSGSVSFLGESGGFPPSGPNR